MSKKFYDTGGKNFSEVLPEIKVIDPPLPTPPNEPEDPDGIIGRIRRDFAATITENQKILFDELKEIKTLLIQHLKANGE